jgi:3-hydroxybutyryl-CoA dehydrogenase
MSSDLTDPRKKAAPRHLGVVGSGTMGVGIAETALAAGLSVTLVDASTAALTRAVAVIGTSDEELRTSTHLDDLASCDTVIEAIAESLDAKRDLFGRLEEICLPSALLATNTSSLRIAAIASTLACPGRFLGMHFFNPVPRMRLVEVVPGSATEAATVRRARELAETIGKRAIIAADGIGFLVNRCGRPFGNEALRLLQERIATAEQIDRICRIGGGFRMGPFELLDLIGLDVNLAINESFWTQSYGEPRWRPSAIQAQMVSSGRLGRKSGRGFYSYEDGARRLQDPEPRARGDGRGRVVSLSGEGVVADALRARAGRAGFVLDDGARTAEVWLALDADPIAPGSHSTEAPEAILCAATDLAGSGRPAAAGFHLIGPVPERGGMVETTTQPNTDPLASARSEELFSALGFELEKVGDAPGLVLGRIVSQLVNEAAFAFGEGVGSATDIDTGARLGLNHPRGPIAWAEAAGTSQLQATLAALRRWSGEERYRISPVLAASMATPGARHS